MVFFDEPLASAGLFARRFGVGAPRRGVDDDRAVGPDCLWVDVRGVRGDSIALGRDVEGEMECAGGRVGV